MLVRLTAKGRRALETLQCGERDVLADVYAALPAQQRAPVLAALETLRAGIGAARAPEACCAPAPVSIRRRPS